LTVENVRVDTPVILEKDASLTLSVETVAVDRLLVFPNRVENVILDVLIVDRVPTLASCKYVVLTVLPVRLEKIVLMVEMLIPFRVE
jgi:hypothetical protein